MQKTILGILVATVVLYLWGFLYWGVSTLPYSSWEQTANDTVAQQVLAEQFPESGTYFVPGVQNEVDQRTAMYSSGPTAFVHIKHGAQTEVDPMVMLAGFIHNLVVVTLMAGFFKVAGAKEFRDFARLAVTAGAVAVVATHIGDMIWWQMPVAWKVWLLVYDYTLWLIVGHLLGIFMKQRASE